MPHPSPVHRLQRIWADTLRRLQLLPPQRFVSYAELQRPTGNDAHYAPDDRGLCVYKQSGRGDAVATGI